MYIFPFHRNHFGFLRNKIIDQLLETHSKSEIIELYKKDMIMFNVKDDFKFSITRLKDIEEKCHIKVSDFLVNNIKKFKLFVDSLFPTDVVLDELCKQFQVISQIDFTILPMNIKNPVFQYHNEQSHYTNQMIEQLELTFIKKNPTSHKYYLQQLIAYLETKNNSVNF